MTAIEKMNGTGGAALRKDAAFIAPRAALGATMLYHGIEKLRAETRQQAGEQFASMGIRPGHFWARATGIAEAGAGIAAITGFLTRPAALAVLVTQAVAISKVHAKNGFASTKGGFEFNLALMAIAAAMLVGGPGRFSAHEAIERVAEGGLGRRRVRGGVLAQALGALSLLSLFARRGRRRRGVGGTIARIARLVK